MSGVNFQEYQDKIQKAIQEKVKNNTISDPDGFILLDGFISIHMQKKLSGDIVLGGGPSVPAISVVGKSTGLIHTFALKILLPNIKI